LPEGCSFGVTYRRTIRRKHQGKIVERTVRVLSVQRRSENLAGSDFSVFFGLPEAQDIMEMGVADQPDGDGLLHWRGFVMQIPKV
jgi:hypothetical protein